MHIPFLQIAAIEVLRRFLVVQNFVGKKVTKNFDYYILY